VFGARPLKRFLQRNVETRLARALITGEVGEGANITFTMQNGELVQVRDPAAAKK
jgi:ATP-dependent Clp protease ATP-binding subunit ClpB